MGGSFQIEWYYQYADLARLLKPMGLYYILPNRKKEESSSGSGSSDSDSDSDSELIGPPVPKQLTGQEDNEDLVGPPLPPGYRGSTADDEDDDDDDMQDDEDDVSLFPLMTQGNN